MLSFAQFLSELGLSYTEYILVVRSTLKRTKVFYHREVSAARINPYNTEVLSMMRANMDIQFVLDPYSCAHYMLDYVSKGQRGMSALLSRTISELNQGNADIRNRLKTICNMYLNNTEISAQEAIYHLLGMQLSRSSRSTAYIDVNPSEERTKVLKSLEQMRQLDSESTEIYLDNMVDYYVNRPNSLDECCLAQFVAKYTYWKKRPKSNKLHDIANDCDDDNANDNEETESIANALQLLNNKGYITERKKFKVLRFRRYSKEDDSDNYYRSRLMLYWPWRNESDDLSQPIVKYEQHKDEIVTTERLFVFNCAENDIEDIYREEEDEELKDDEQTDNNEFAVYSSGPTNADIELEMSNSISKPAIEVFRSPSLLSKENLLCLTRQLNERQSKYLLELLNCVRCHPANQIFHFITGGAGTGKSMLINAINQMLIRHFRSVRNNLKDESIPIVLCAPTGKAAHNIGGTTLHSCFALPVSKNANEIKPLSDDKCNSLRSKLWDLEFVIIDEISMVGARMFGNIDKRMRQIYNTKEVFGGKNIICFGDFNQLRPVMDSFVFMGDKRNDISALTSLALWNNFQMYELNEIMRQKDDLTFALSLNALATGTLTDDQITLFKSREMAKLNANPSESSIRLFRCNKDVNEYNILAINRCNSEAFTSIAKDTLQKVTTNRNAALSAASNMSHSDTQGLPMELTLKVGIKYMVTANINVADGLCNGATGILRSVDYTVGFDSKKYPCRAFLEFPDITTGQELRKSQNCKNKLTPIDKISRQIQVLKSQDSVVTRTQFPLVPAEALTIAKSQGQTYDSVVVSIITGERPLSKSELYVALSRAKSLSGLYIDGIFSVPNTTFTDHHVRNEIDRLMNEANLLFNLEFFAEIDSGVKIIHHNVQSLHSHYQDILFDRNMMTADILLLTEINSLSTDVFKFPYFDHFARIDCIGCRRQGFGAGIFSKLPFVIIGSIQVKMDNCHMELLAVDFRNFSIILAYCSPLCRENDIAENIVSLVSKFNNGKDMFIVGDLNVNLLDKKTHPLVNCMALLGLSLGITDGIPSTVYGSQLDILFTNRPVMKSFYSQSFFSDHFPLCFII